MSSLLPIHGTETLSPAFVTHVAGCRIDPTYRARLEHPQLLSRSVGMVVPRTDPIMYLNASGMSFLSTSLWHHQCRVGLPHNPGSCAGGLFNRGWGLFNRGWGLFNRGWGPFRHGGCYHIGQTIHHALCLCLELRPDNAHGI